MGLVNTIVFLSGTLTQFLVSAWCGRSRLRCLPSLWLSLVGQNLVRKERFDVGSIKPNSASLFDYELAEGGSSHWTPAVE